MVVKASDVLVIFCLSLSLLLPSVSAIDVVESQEDITLTLERDSYYEFPLMLQNVDEMTTLESAGDIDGWITFWGKTNHTCQIYPGQSYVLVTIDVPKKADLGEYDGEIKAGTKTLSQVKVKVTLDLSNVIANKDVADLQDKVDVLTDSIRDLRSHVATLEYNVSEKVEKIYEYQKDLTMLEKENEQLTEENEELEVKYTETAATNEELNDLTGALVGTQLPGMFIGGILLGTLTMVTLIRRETLKRKLKRKLGMSTVEKPHHKEFKYSFKK